jgi:hypothetical protein
MCVFIYYLKSETFWLGQINIYTYCLNNNCPIYGKNQFFTIFIETLNSNGYLSLFFFHYIIIIVVYLTSLCVNWAFFGTREPF